jgi:hypothetical protein
MTSHGLAFVGKNWVALILNRDYNHGLYSCSRLNVQARDRVVVQFDFQEHYTIEKDFSHSLEMTYK